MLIEMFELECLKKYFVKTKLKMSMNTTSAVKNTLIRSQDTF